MYALLWYLNKAARHYLDAILSAMCMCNATGSLRHEIDVVVESSACGGHTPLSLVHRTRL